MEQVAQDEIRPVQQEHIHVETRSFCALLRIGTRIGGITMTSSMIRLVISPTTRVVPPRRLGQPTPSLPVASTFHQYVLQLLNLSRLL